MIKSGSRVSVEYTLKLDDGSVGLHPGLSPVMTGQGAPGLQPNPDFIG